MKIPIVLVAFGTTTRALDTYSFMDGIFRRRFESHPIEWAYSSRMVKDFIKTRKDVDLKSPTQVISELLEKGHKWVVVQSLHLICGHEFYRMLQEVRELPIRSSIGLPLLSTPADYHDVARGYKTIAEEDRDRAVIFVGHGTDHPAWVSYLGLLHILREMAGPNVFVGAIEGEPSRDKVIGRVIKDGFKKAYLVPLMLVAGTHFREDLVGAEDSWKHALEARGLMVSEEERGMGYCEAIVDIFCRHIAEAMEIAEALSSKVNTS